MAKAKKEPKKAVKKAIKEVSNATTEEVNVTSEPVTETPVVTKSNTKISKLMIWPSRKVNIGNYETIDLNAGVEIAFEEPVLIDSPQVQEALADARKFIKLEFAKQFWPYKDRVNN